MCSHVGVACGGLDAAVAEQGRKPDIMGDAAHAVLCRPSKECTGNFFIDEAVLKQEGVTDFAKYLVTPGTTPLQDYFLD